MGFARIPEDRHNTGTIGEMSVWENLVSRRNFAINRCGNLAS